MSQPIPLHQFVAHFVACRQECVGRCAERVVGAGRCVCKRTGARYGRVASAGIAGLLSEWAELGLAGGAGGRCGKGLEGFAKIGPHGLHSFIHSSCVYVFLQ